MIRQNWLPNKSPNEIRHRYKNMTCAKAQDNLIKKWKNTHNIPFTDLEEAALAKAIKWFGINTNRWVLISKCFLPNRNPSFLKHEFNQIMQDKRRSERFGKLLLQDEEGENGEAFEEIDLDQESLEEEEEEELDSEERGSDLHSESNESESMEEDSELME
mmetsp:Transcript_4480/g.4205  ORF Transcript_4480/g.4205 Transcript_4480/m.4205 type:complete len:160 (-) Transcript_4480:28-507(-)